VSGGGVVISAPLKLFLFVPGKRLQPMARILRPAAKWMRLMVMRPDSKGEQIVE
jgi:hypothetical protein